jgi:hypothetical protein
MRTAVGIALGLCFFAGLVFATLRETAVACEVCVDFGGRSECRRASGAGREEALQMAQSTACAVLAAGVTQGMACQRTTPRSASCESD